MRGSTEYEDMFFDNHRIPPWLAMMIQVAREGQLQAYLIVLSVTVMGAHFVTKTNIKYVKKNNKRMLHDALNHMLRFSSFVTLYLAPLATDRYGSTVFSLAYICVVGFAKRQLSHPHAHHFLQQVVLLSVATFILMFSAHVVPLLIIGNTAEPDFKALGSTTFLFLSILVSSIAPRDWTTPLSAQVTKEAGPSREETASWLDYWCTFGRMTPLIAKGWHSKITSKDLASLPWDYQPSYLLQRIKQLRQKNHSTAKTLFALLWLDASFAALSASMFFITELIKPLGMYCLLDYLAHPDEAVFKPYIWLFVIIFGRLFGTIAQQQMAFHSSRTSLKLQIALTSEIYSHAMQSHELDHDFLSRSGGKGTKRSSTGLLTNLMSTDIKTIIQGRTLIMLLFGGPVGGILGLISLYKIIGWPCFVGLAISTLTAPITTWISSYSSDAEEKAKDSQNARVSLSTEYFRSIKIVKYFGWEEIVAGQMEKSRDEEQGHIWNVALLSTASTDVASMIPTLALAVVFALYSGYQGNPMTASVAFITIDLMDIVRDNTEIVSIVGRMVPRLRLSMNRIDRYIAAASPKGTFPEGRLSIKNATFQRTISAEFKLHDISVDFVHGGLNVVVGASGSGKTSLLLSILGETVLKAGNVIKPRDVAFAPQSPWLQAESFRDNILFTAVYDAVRYWKVVKACCLDVDLAELENGDETNIGEDGQLLSGGQRARVSLARALLSDAPLLLLDDIFSALDSTTSISRNPLAERSKQREKHVDS